MKTIATTALLSCFWASSALAASADYKRDVKLAKGRATVEFTTAASEGRPSGPAKHPRVGIAPSPSPSFGNFLAKQLDEAGKVEVVPSSRLQAVSMTLGGGFEELMRSELVAAVASSCRAGKLDYLLVMGVAQTSMKTDITTFIVGFGRMRMRHIQQSRLYDCRSQQVVWKQSVLFETSQGAMSSALSGNGMGALLGGPEAEQAMAGVYAEKLTADLAW